MNGTLLRNRLEMRDWLNEKVTVEKVRINFADLKSQVHRILSLDTDPVLSLSAQKRQ